MTTGGSFVPCAFPELLLAAWDYGGAGSVIADLTGNGHSFVMTGSTGRVGGYTYGGTQPLTQGIRQAAAEIQLGPPIAGLQPANITVMTWAITGPADPSWMLEYHRDVPDDTGVFGWLNAGGVFRGRAKDAANTPFDVTVPTDSPNWHHHAISYDGTNFNVYRDGVLVSSLAMGAVWAADILRIFTNAGAGVTISETRIFGAALSQLEIASWMTTPVV